MEQLDLTAPVQPPSVTTYTIDSLNLNWSVASIDVVLKDNIGNTLTFNYNGPTAVTLMLALNTANLSIKSLYRRVLEKLVADGKISGTVSGTP
jgi:hypothetical protein